VLNVALVGCGNIGSQLAREIQRRFRGRIRLIGVYDNQPRAGRRLARRLHPVVPVLSPHALFRRCDLLIEAASPRAVEELLPLAVRRRKSLLVLSSGGLLGKARWLRKARALGVPVHVPSGALAGLDAIKAAATGGLRSVTLTTRKPPRSLVGAPGIRRRRIRLEGLRRPRTVYEGPASRAVREFPENINVAATLSLAGLGAWRTRVRLIADPRVHTNIHEVEAVGRFGRLVARTENRPSRANPKTSELAVQSAVATLRQLVEPLRVGT